jgi:serine/threonine protein phosphatase PrpC
MKHLLTLVIAIIFLGYSCNSSPKENSVENKAENPTVDKSTIQVGVFDGHGGS